MALTRVHRAWWVGALLMVASAFVSGCSAVNDSWNWLTRRAAVEPDCRRVLAEAAPNAPPGAVFAAGLCLEAAGRRAEAIAAFADAGTRLERADARARAHHNLGTLMALSGRDADAIDAFRAALRLGDRDATRLNFELVARRLGRPPARRTANTGEDARLFAAARALEQPRRQTTTNSRLRRDW